MIIQDGTYMLYQYRTLPVDGWNSFTIQAYYAPDVTSGTVPSTNIIIRPLRVPSLYTTANSNGQVTFDNFVKDASTDITAYPQISLWVSDDDENTSFSKGSGVFKEYPSAEVELRHDASWVAGSLWELRLYHIRIAEENDTPDVTLIWIGRKGGWAPFGNNVFVRVDNHEDLEDPPDIVVMGGT